MLRCHEMAKSDIYDLLILTDASSLMSECLKSLKQSLPGIVRLLELTRCFSRIGVGAACENTTRTEWSGWYATTEPSDITRKDLFNFINSLKPVRRVSNVGGAKASLAYAYGQMRREAITMLLIYTDSAPSWKGFSSLTKSNKIERETSRLQDAYGLHYLHFKDWVSTADIFRDGKRAQVFSFVPSTMSCRASPYAFLSAKTGGTCIVTSRYQTHPTDLICKMTLDVILIWIGFEEDDDVAPAGRHLKEASLAVYDDASQIHQITSEAHSKRSNYWDTEREPINWPRELLFLRASYETFKAHVSSRKPIMTGFSKRCEYEEGFRSFIVQELKDIIKSDMAALSTHDILIDLWQSDQVLSSGDRQFLNKLYDYKVLVSLNRIPLSVEVRWVPKRRVVPIGPFVTCKVCRFRRSVTIMAQDSVCMWCDKDDHTYPIQKAHETPYEQELQCGVDERTLATWHECSNMDCRGQYVTYRPDVPGSKPECHYCQAGGNTGNKSLEPTPTTPTVECQQCLSRMIWPKEYRPQNFSAATFTCPACISGHPTISETSATPKQLKHDNKDTWLLRYDDQEGSTSSLDESRALIPAISASGTGGAAERIHILPEPGASEPPIILQHDGKPIRNTPDILDTLLKRTRFRKAELSSCDLCYSSFAAGDLDPACGRSGCSQRICQRCRSGCYEQNRPGRTINVAALCCPFCRRRPSMKTLSCYPLGRLVNTRAVVENAHTWIYAWCRRCDIAKQYQERACTANGVLPEINNWRCEGCSSPRKMAGLLIKYCPGCHVPSIKAGGCNHMTCTTCRTHWCFACGRDFSPEDIYKHMNDEHGGLGIEREVLTDGDDNDYEDDDDGNGGGYASDGSF